MEPSKIQIIRDINKRIYPEVKVDGNIIPVRAFSIVWDAHDQPGLIKLDMLLKSCEINVDGTVEINGFPVTEEIGRQIYQKLKTKYGE